MQFLNVRATDPLYKCWKRANNESVLFLMQEEKLNGEDSVYKYLEETYGCKTLHVQKHTLRKIVRHVDLEFPSEQHLTMFLLRWS
jgi:hypothetical protein